MDETAPEAVTVNNQEEMMAEYEDPKTRDLNQMGLTSSVKWDMFVPGMLLRLRVLLVEADDSTRRIIAALLRKCSYRVAAVPDGLRAWEILKGKPHNVDLILTEVELPSISGFALLTLIMEDEICKSIPVVMMSSKDSISLILKCMLKGAADFLIKPVRRNELRNLWQHVWRRQMLTAGTVRHSAAVGEQKVEATSKNYVTSNRLNDGLDSTEKNHQVSVEESDTQRSCTTPHTEAESAYMPNMQGVSNPIYADACKLNNAQMHEECAEIIEESAIYKSGPESNIVKYGEQLASCKEAYNFVTVEMGGDHLFAKSVVKEPTSHKELASSVDEISSGTKELVKPQAIIDLIGNFIKCEPNADGQWCAEHSTEKFNVSPRLELSLGRSFPTCRNEEQHKLGHSRVSAFSRYDNNNKVMPPVFPPMADVSTVSKEDANASDNQFFSQQPAVYTFWGHGAAFSNLQENLTSSEPGHSGMSRGAFPQVGLGFLALPGVRSEGGLCPPTLHAQPGFSPIWISKPECEQSPIPTSSSIYSTSEVQDPEQGFCSFEQTANASAEEKEQTDYNELRNLEAIRVVSPKLGSYDFCSSVTNNLSTVISASICITSEENSTAAPDIRKTDLAGRIDDSNLRVNNGKKGDTYCCTNRREAALIKFRLKRKDRCYKKKVRYQSRKRLAEQRPRVKGQFVRQV